MISATKYSMVFVLAAESAEAAFNDPQAQQKKVNDSYLIPASQRTGDQAVHPSMHRYDYDNILRHKDLEDHALLDGLLLNDPAHEEQPSINHRDTELDEQDLYKHMKAKSALAKAATQNQPVLPAPHPLEQAARMDLGPKLEKAVVDDAKAAEEAKAKFGQLQFYFRQQVTEAGTTVALYGVYDADGIKIEQQYNKWLWLANELDQKTRKGFLNLWSKHWAFQSTTKAGLQEVRNALKALKDHKKTIYGKSKKSNNKTCERMKRKMGETIYNQECDYSAQNMGERAYLLNEWYAAFVRVANQNPQNADRWLVFSNLVAEMNQ